MDKQLKVAYLGMKPSENEEHDWMSEMGIRIYTMNVETAIDVIQNSHKGKLSNSIVPGLPTPENGEQVMMGGRFMVFLSRDEISDLVKGTDLLIVSGCIDYYEARAFLIWLTPDNIPETCTIVLRMPFTEDEQPYQKYKSDKLLRQMGLNDNGEVIMKKKKKFKKGKFIKKRTVFVIGLESYGGINPEEGIPLLRSHLLKEDVTEQVIQPVKETVSAGKSLFGLGKSLTNWMSRLVKTN